MNIVLALVELDENMSYGERILQSLLIAAVCILIVFAMLMLLWGIISLFKFLPKGKEKQEETKPEVASTPNKRLQLEDIKDDDMMVAALVAAIDYRNETKEDVRIVSIKEL